jgi:hypothetical protein
MEGRKGTKRRWIDIELLSPKEGKQCNEDKYYAEQVSQKMKIYCSSGFSDKHTYR